MAPKKLWERALANRAHWDKVQLARDGFAAKAKLENARVREKARVAAIVATTTATPAEPCPHCGTAQETREGAPEPVHLGPPCPAAMPRIHRRLQTRSVSVTYCIDCPAGKVKNVAIRDGRCTLHAMRHERRAAAQSATFRPHAEGPAKDPSSEDSDAG